MLVNEIAQVVVLVLRLNLISVPAVLNLFYFVLVVLGLGLYSHNSLKHLPDNAHQRDDYYNQRADD